MLNKIIMYRCSFCGKEFRTANKHKCKKDPSLKNCFSCKHHNGWEEIRTEMFPEIIVQCEKDNEYYLEDVKQSNYSLQCDDWEEVVKS